jgi:hypothetical protein
MRLPIVDTRTIPEELDYLRVWRVDPTRTPGVTLELQPVERGHAAWLTTSDDATARVALDAEFAGELASAAQQLATLDPDVLAARDADDWTYVIELGWAGTAREFRVSHEPAEEALRAIVRRVAPLTAQPLELHVRRVTEPRDDA